MPYYMVNDLSCAQGHFKQGQLVPRGSIPEKIFKSWVKTKTLLFQEIELDDADAVADIDMEAQLDEEEEEGDGEQAGLNDEPLTEEELAAADAEGDPSTGQPASVRAKPDWGHKPKAGPKKGGPKKTPPPPAK